MKKILSLLVMLLLFLLAACGPATDENETDGGETAVANEDLAAETDAEETGETNSEVEASEEDTAVADSTFSPAQNLDELSDLRDRDWTKGADEPLISIIEYGDFQ